MSISINRPWLLVFAIALFASPYANAAFTPPASNRAIFNFNYSWKFIMQDVAGAQDSAFNDAAWRTISAPHTYNDSDSYDEWIGFYPGEKNKYMGKTWYRKHFKIPSQYQGRKVFLEFEKVRQAIDLYVNGVWIGRHENGVSPAGFDISSQARFGDRENVVAALVNNSESYQEAGTQTTFNWNESHNNTNYGGITGNVYLHITDKVYQTLPLFGNLGTTGIYVYADQFNIAGRSATVHVESQVKNERTASASVTLRTVIVDKNGAAIADFSGQPATIGAGATQVIMPSSSASNLVFWDITNPCLYRVYTVLSVDNVVTDVCRTVTGFRSIQIAPKARIKINDRPVPLWGFAPAANNPWAGLGNAYPEWLHDWDKNLMRGCGTRLLRWMHTAPGAQDIHACDRYGITQICAAGDAEANTSGRQWSQRVDLMRDLMIYYRNNPSILLWEAGNTAIGSSHLRDMDSVRDIYDPKPKGGRGMGGRDTDPTTYGDYISVMMDGYDNAYTSLLGQSALLAVEYMRDEAVRRVWDDYSPPSFGYTLDSRATQGYSHTSESWIQSITSNHMTYFYGGVVSNPRVTPPGNPKIWAGWAKIIWADANTMGRQWFTEVCRNSGFVDGVRLPKEAYYATAVIWNDTTLGIHIVGHWTYPAGTKKAVYIVSTCDSVQLYINGVLKGAANHPMSYNDNIFKFDSIAWAPGTIRAVGLNKSGAIQAQQEKHTAGTARALRLTPIAGPSGLQADANDVALIDVEVIDSAGNRCPTDQADVQFSLSGPALWMGGYNSGIQYTVRKTTLQTECGINRIAIRSTLVPGTITVGASRSGLIAANVTLQSHAVAITDGLSTGMPDDFAWNDRAPVMGIARSAAAARPLLDMEIAHSTKPMLRIVSKKAGMIGVTVVDYRGRIVCAQRIFVAAGSGCMMPIFGSAGALASGIYLVQVSGHGTRVVREMQIAR